MQTTMTIPSGPAVPGTRTMSGLSSVLAGLAVYETARFSAVQIAEARIAEPAGPAT